MENTQNNNIAGLQSNFSAEPVETLKQGLKQRDELIKMFADVLSTTDISPAMIESFHEFGETGNLSELKEELEYYLSLYREYPPVKLKLEQEASDFSKVRIAR